MIAWLLDFFRWLQTLVFGTTTISGVNNSHATITHYGATVSELMFLITLLVIAGCVITFLAYKWGRSRPRHFKETSAYQELLLREYGDELKEKRDKRLKKHEKEKD